MEKAIKCAIKGGYKATWDSSCGPIIPIENGFNNVGKEYAVLDPEFWKCLGKACDWDTLKIKFGINCGNYLYINDWKYQWHRFIDHIAQGKDIDSFFDNLLK